MSDLKQQWTQHNVRNFQYVFHCLGIVYGFCKRGLTYVYRQLECEDLYG